MKLVVVLVLSIVLVGPWTTFAHNAFDLFGLVQDAGEIADPADHPSPITIILDNPALAPMESIIDLAKNTALGAPFAAILDVVDLACELHLEKYFDIL